MKIIQSIFMMALAVGLLAGVYGCKKSGDKTPPPAGAQTTTTTANAQTMCPVLNNPIDKSVFADHEGKRVYFCCSDCIDKFKAEPEKYIKQMEDKGIVLEKTPK